MSLPDRDPRRAARTSLRLAAGLLALASAPSAQYGTIVREQKLASASGNLGANLGNDYRFGVSVADLGDFDGDGIRDLLAGAHRANRGGVERGAVWILRLNADGTVKSRQELSALAGGLPGPIDDHDRFGISACALGDLDLDGTTDIAVGAYRDDDGGLDHGAVYVLFLNPDGTVKAQQKISQTSGGLAAVFDQEDSFGWSVEPIGDLDGDGILDLAVGATRDDGAEADLLRDYGAVYLLQLRRDGTVKATTRLAADTPPFGAALRPGDRFGADVALLGDLDGDGTEDIAVGAFGDDPLKSGRVFVMPLNANGTVKSYTEIGAGLGGFTGLLGKSDRFGISLASDDLDGDGIQDLLVGAVGDDDGGADAGALWVLKLDVTGHVTDHEKISPDFGGFGGLVLPGDNFGISCATLGDVDRDGAVDLAVGAYQDDEGGFDRGAVWMLFRAGTGVPVADFGTAPGAGEAPLGVQFNDLSSGNVTSWAWDFGDGSSAAVRHPLHTYTEGGAFNVTLTVSGPLGNDSLLRRRCVVVAEPVLPVADFTLTPGSGPDPLVVQFLDASSGPVTSWSWDFGDGNTSGGISPTHTYTALGSYTVSLTVAGPNGVDNKTLFDAVQVVLPPPTPDASFAPAAGLVPLTVAFTDLSSGGVTAWSWDFGDGTGSNEPSPLHEYGVPGRYDVTLTISGPSGTTSRSWPEAVHVRAPLAADFEAAPRLVAAGMPVQFTDLSAGEVSSFTWDFGDGTGASTGSPSHVYAAPGLYSVALTVSGIDGSSSLTRADWITVLPPPPVADFSGTPTTGILPLAVDFTDLSSGEVDGWSWNFGDGTSSTERHPQHLYTTAGTFTVTLTASGPGGTHTSTRTGYVRVDEPLRAAFRVSNPGGAAPENVGFTDTSSGVPTSWSWDFGDGSRSSQRHPTHLYDEGGTFHVVLTVTRGSETSSAEADVVIAEPPPDARFSVSTTAGDAALTVRFTDRSLGNITRWEWDFGDGSPFVEERHPTHVYQRPGVYTVRFRVTSAGGVDTIVRRDFITVRLPKKAGASASAPTPSATRDRRLPPP